MQMHVFPPATCGFVRLLGDNDREINYLDAAKKTFGRTSVACNYMYLFNQMHVWDQCGKICKIFKGFNYTSVKHP